MFREVRCRWCSGRFEIADADGIHLECLYCHRNVLGPQESRPALAAGLYSFGYLLLMGGWLGAMVSIGRGWVAFQPPLAGANVGGSPMPAKYGLALALIGLLASAFLLLAGTLLFRAGRRRKARGLMSLAALGSLLASATLGIMLLYLHNNGTR